MAFSYNLVLALFLLAPGFAAFAGLYHGSRFGPIQSPPPPPNSILALTIVSFGALVAHLAGSLFFITQDFACSAGLRCASLSFDPNPYAGVRLDAAMASGQVWTLLLTLILLTVTAFLATRASAAGFARHRAVKDLLYGWLAEVGHADTAGEVILAYVLSDVEEAGVVLGYEGALANLTANADKEITSVLLLSCESFYLSITASGVTRHTVSKSTAIPQLYLDREHIKNIAFERVRFD